MSGPRPNYEQLLGIQNLIRVYNLILIIQDHFIVNLSLLLIQIAIAKTDANISGSSFVASS